VVSGTIFVPRAIPAYDRHDSRANRENWVIKSSIAYVAQITWIENATIRDNILFGLPFDRDRYQDTLAAAALQTDLETFDDGDLTEVGSQGINLSGGQRWRVTLARALYSRAEILVLDDIFSAVDAHVGRHILEKALTGKLSNGRTRILATHHVALSLPKAAYAVQLCDNGKVQEIMSPQKLVNSDARSKDNIGNGGTPEMTTTTPTAGGSTDATLSKPRTFVEEEFREQGSIRWSVYKKYITSSGALGVWALAVAVVVASQLALLARGWWMKLWTESGEKHSRPHHSTAEANRQIDQKGRSLAFYMGFYVAISLSAAFLEAVKCAFVYVVALRSSRRLFESLTRAVLRAPLRWLDTVPLGRILNRFTADFALIDSRIPGDTHMFMSAILSVSIISVAGMAVSFYMIAPAIMLLVISLHYTSRYLAGAREIRRLESTAKSPIMELYGTSLAGLSTIRAFDKVDVYISRMMSLLDNQSRSNWAFWLVSQWMDFRMGVIGSLFALFVGVTIVAEDIDASLAGFALSFTFGYTTSIEDAINRFSNLQLNMNSTERVKEFLKVDAEDYAGLSVPTNWPSEGHISIQELQVGYAPALPSVLKGLSVEIKPRQRVGVVGRTGAGKSSLALALFRFLEARSGSINIDGLDISTLKLEQLRARLAIIPQDPVLFAGTVRSNLDPLGQQSDELLLQALRRVHLIDVLRRATTVRRAFVENNDTSNNGYFNAFESLDSCISEGGLNLSQGQRQLLCLARVVITQSKIMLLDEATSAVDMKTDSLIQRSIREEFKQSTLIVVAHRLSTVADFDRILVMADGKAVEYGEPRELLVRKGEFWKLVCESGERERLERIINGEDLLG
jgi:ABC-type multidrug transport system fused ATPase/permease subunit